VESRWRACGLLVGRQDGAKIASASLDETVRVWEVGAWTEAATLEGHGGAVWMCAWSPDGKRLASASDDQTVCVWLAPPVAPMLTEGQANSVNAPDSSLGAFVAQAKRLAESVAKASARELTAANTRAEASDTRARRLEGDPEALQGCSLEELRQVGWCRLTPG
jgi:hypothetical protein